MFKFNFASVNVKGFEDLKNSVNSSENAQSFKELKDSVQSSVDASASAQTPKYDPASEALHDVFGGTPREVTPQYHEMSANEIYTKQANEVYNAIHAPNAQGTGTFGLDHGGITDGQSLFYANGILIIAALALIAIIIAVIRIRRTNKRIKKEKALIQESANMQMQQMMEFMTAQLSNVASVAKSSVDKESELAELTAKLEELKQTRSTESE